MYACIHTDEYIHKLIKVTRTYADFASTPSLSFSSSRRLMHKQETLNNTTEICRCCL